ncbi:ankyrin repeat-containing domain protein [Mycena polygramma]|nr:ankyrin repeat-containing domain protein [Mycena polygramma]
MSDIVGIVASILQFIDTVAKTRDYIQAFRNAPRDQQQLLKEIESLDPLIRELDQRISGGHAGLVKNLESPLKEVKELLEQLTERLDLQGIQKFRSRVTWSLWEKKDIEDGLETIERFKSMLNAWLGVHISSSAQDISSAISNVAEEQQIDHSYIIRSLASSSKAQDGHHERTASLLQNAAEKHQINHHYLSKAVKHVGKNQEKYYTRTTSLLENLTEEQQTNHYYLSKTVRNVGKQQEHFYNRTISVLENAGEEQEVNYTNLSNSVRNVRDSQEQFQTTAERDHIIEWYSPLNMFLRQADIFSVWEPGTGMWLLEHNSFRGWSSATGNILWCQGMPGAGKTVLASLVTNTLRLEAESQNIGVGVIYLDHSETDMPSPARLLAAIWRQLVVEKPLSPDLYRLYRKHRERRTRPTIEEDRAVLRSTILEYPKVFIIVDGLDEYPEKHRDILLRDLMALGPHVNLLLTSRPHITIGHMVPSYEIFEIRATGDDICKYLHGQISKSSRLYKHVTNSPNLHQELEEMVVERSDGMFLLAKLHVDSLTEKRTVREIRDALNDMADNLEVAYGAVVDRIDRQNQGDRKLAWRILSWVTHAKRPLRQSELIEALAVEPGAMELDPENLPEMDIILSVCAGLVVINEEDDKIRLIHYTTELYLQSPHVQAKAFPRAQSEITMTCITYLSLGFEVMADKLKQAVFLFTHNPFLHYAVDYCLVHARGEPELQIQTSILSFLSQCSVWRRLWDWKRGGRTLVADRLWIAAVFRLDEICTQIIHEDAVGFCTLLQGAILHGWSSDVVRILLERSADAPSRVKDGFSELLQLATLRRATYVVQLLLENGVDLQANGREYGSLALREASRRGFDDIVSLLIDHNVVIDGSGQYGAAPQIATFRALAGNEQSLQHLTAQTNSEATGCYGTALCAASEGGHIKVAKLLIEHGANVNAEGGQALTVASKSGNAEVTKLLIDHGACANGGQALRAALNSRNAEIVKLLIASGVADSSSALWDVSKNGNAEAVKLLIEAGTDINANGGQALWAASKCGSAEVVKLLLERGADVDANGGGALWVASEQGHEEVAKLLIESDADINANRWQALCAAASDSEDAEVVKLLSDGPAHSASEQCESPLYAASADIRASRECGSPLYAASWHGHEGVVKLLIEHGAGIQASGEWGSPLRAASEQGHEGIVKLLIENGADSGSVLRAAAENGRAEVAKLLIEAGAGYWEVLRTASENGSAEVVKRLIEAGADIDARDPRDRWGLTVLGAASQDDDAKAVKFLIEAGADVDANGGYALWIASKDGNVEVAKLLIEAGAKVDAGDGLALWTASRSGNVEVFKLLLAGGADAGGFARSVKAQECIDRRAAMLTSMQTR